MAEVLFLMYFYQIELLQIYFGSEYKEAISDFGTCFQPSLNWKLDFQNNNWRDRSFGHYFNFFYGVFSQLHWNNSIFVRVRKQFQINFVDFYQTHWTSMKEKRSTCCSKISFEAQLKFRYSEKATKSWPFFHSFLTLLSSVKL